MLLLLVLACVSSSPLPSVGECADYPSGTYEFGQIGIGTCLAGPASIRVLNDGGALVVTNTNPFLDFTSGSVLSLDLALLDEGLGRNLVSDLAPAAVELPNFSGASAWAEPYDMLLVASRNSEGARTREADDFVWMVDLANPRAPQLATGVGPDKDGAAIAVGYDPNEIVYDAESDRAWTINRTEHTVATIDLASRPARLVPPGGDGRLEAEPFVDVDGSGSRAVFSEFDTQDAESILADEWSLRWSAATVRGWVSTPSGLYRVLGNGEGAWERSAIAYEVELDDTVVEMRDPAWGLSDAATSRLVFVSEGSLYSAGEAGDGETWTVSGTALLSPTEDEVALADPYLVYEGGVWLLYYTAGSPSAIHLASSTDGTTFTREGEVVVGSGFGAAEPSVLWDEQVERYRLWYVETGEDGTTALATAHSDDLLNWTSEEVSALAGISSPTVSFWSGRFHVLYGVESDAERLYEATSADGVNWVELGPTLAGEAGSFMADGVALQVANEAAFRLTSADGSVYPIAVSPGEQVGSLVQGWSIEATVGHMLGPEDVSALGEAGVQLTSLSGSDAWLNLEDDDGVLRVGHASLSGGEFTVSDDPALEPGGDEDFDVDGVHDAVYALIDGVPTLYYAGEADGVTRIGRATSPDGLTWTKDADPVYEGVDTWNAVAVVPGSVVITAEGVVQLWYSGTEGEVWRVGLLESTDGGLSFVNVENDEEPWQLNADSPGTWNDSGVRDPLVIRGDDVERMWFSGFDGDVWQVGYAERAVGDSEWLVALDADETARPVLDVATGAAGAEAVQRPIVVEEGEGWRMYYAALDGGAFRVAQAVARAPDRWHRDLAMPTLADTWGFTVVPPNDATAIDLDVSIGTSSFGGVGCMSLAHDEVAGQLYVGCKLIPVLYVLDVRDDSTTTWTDLNYLGVEAVVVVETSTGADTGLRDLLVDRVRGRIVGIIDEPESVVLISTELFVDDEVADVLRDQTLGYIPLPRSLERDEGVPTQAGVGPGQMALHPDGEHLFVSNFNTNTVSVINLDRGPLGMVVAEAEAVGENPYALTLTPDGTRAWVANYTGEVDGYAASTLLLLDADPTSPSFLSPITWVVNQ